MSCDLSRLLSITEAAVGLGSCVSLPAARIESVLSRLHSLNVTIKEPGLSRFLSSISLPAPGSQTAQRLDCITTLQP